MSENESLELTEEEIKIASGEDQVEDVGDNLPPKDAEFEAQAEDQEGDPEEPSDDEPSDEESDQETDTDGDGDGGETEVADSWVTDNLKTLAASYGLSEGDLGSFSSEEDFRMAASLADKQIIAKKEVKREPEEKKEEATDGKLPWKLDRERFEKADFDEDTLAFVDAHNKLCEAHEGLTENMKTMQDRATQVEAESRVNAFHDLVDTMDEDLFGKSIDESGNVLNLSETLDKNRRELHETAEDLASNIERRGQELPPFPVLLQRAKTLAFGEQIADQQKQEKREAVTKQSRERRSAAGTTRKQTPTKKEYLDMAEEVADNPEIKKVWDELHDSSGNERR